MQLSRTPPEVSREIHPHDGMWQPGESWYFRVGRSALRAVELAVAESWLPTPRSFLDLPCGHGRVARYLRAAYPEAEMHFCDIDAEGADFCAARFGGQSIHSVAELTEVALPTVDVIWVGSLFTHVDAERTRRWLAYLCRHLNPEGVLVATFHGNWSTRMQTIYPMIDAASWDTVLAGCEREGFGYARYPHGRAGDYGISLSTPAWVCDAVAAIPGVRLVGYRERGWAENQDVAVIARDDRLRPWTPDFRDWK